MDFSDRCRTCLELKNTQSFVNINKHCFLGKTYRGIINMLIPETHKSLTDENTVCPNCAETLKRCVALIQNCLVIEAYLKKIKFPAVENSTEKDTPAIEEANTDVSNIYAINVKNTEGTEINSISTLNVSDSKRTGSSDTQSVSVTSTSINTAGFVPNISPEVSEIKKQSQGDEPIVISDDNEDIESNKLLPLSQTLLSEIKDHDRVISIKPIDYTDKLTFLIASKTKVMCISKTNSIGKKRILLVGNDVPQQCWKCFKSVKNLHEHVCDPTYVQAELPKVKKQCPKCNSEVFEESYHLHLRKHRREERKAKIKLKKEEHDKLKEIESKKRREAKEKAREKARLTCTTCKGSFDSKEELELHLELHPPYVCEVCGKGCVRKETLKAHMDTHNDPNSYICEVCGKGYKHARMLQVHCELHQDNSYKCKLCSKEFKLKSRLTRHVKYVHEKKLNYLCTECGRLFINGSQLDNHIRLVHMKEKTFECDVCHKKFGRFDYLQNHRYVHSGEMRPANKKKNKIKTERDVVRRRKKLRYTLQDNGEPAQCKFCGLWFKDVIRLKRHLETHVKRYPCHYCPLTFSRKALCQRHEKGHRGGLDNTLRCDVCWKRFETSAVLQEHVKTHDNPRHACDLCGKMFNRRFLMNHHKLMEHSNMPDDDEVEEIIYDSLLEVVNDESVIQLVT